MNKTISLREMILLVILVVLVAYYFVVQGPIKRETESLERAQAEADIQLEEMQDKVFKKKYMEKELEEILKDSQYIKMLADYDNINYIMAELNGIFAKTNKYNINFGDLVMENKIARRNIEVSCTTDNYEKAKDIISEVQNSDNRYLITDVSIVNNPFKEGRVGCNLNINITSFEYVEE